MISTKCYYVLYRWLSFNFFIFYLKSQSLHHNSCQNRSTLSAVPLIVIMKTSLMVAVCFKNCLGWSTKENTYHHHLQFVQLLDIHGFLTIDPLLPPKTTPRVTKFQRDGSHDSRVSSSTQHHIPKLYFHLSQGKQTFFLELIHIVLLERHTYIRKNFH